MAYIGQDPVIGRYILVDQISGGFNGTASGFTLAAGGQGVVPGLAQNVLLSLGGVIQQPGTDYTVSGSGITFTTPPLSGTTFFATVLGDVQAVGTPSDGTVLPASIATSGTFVFPNITTTGTTLIASGNASTPSLAVIGDTNTGLYSPGADQLAISTGGTGRLFIDANGNIGVGTSSPASGRALTLNNSSNYYGLELQVGGTSIGSLIQETTGALYLSTTTASGTLVFRSANQTEAARIDSSGRLLVGTSSARANLYNSTFTSLFQVEGTSYGATGGLFVCNINDDTTCSVLNLVKSRGTTVGSNTLVSSGDTVGALSFSGNDGTEFVQTALIKAEIDGTPGANDMPGRLVFSTTADGASSPTERMRITSAGLVGIGTSAPGGLLEVKSADQNPNLYRLYNAYNAGASSWGVDFYRDTDSGTNLSVAEIKAVRTGGNASELKFGTSSTPGTVVERVRISSSGNVGIGTSSPSVLTHLSTSTDTQLRVESTSASGTNEAAVQLIRGSNQSAIKNKAGGLEFFVQGLTNEVARIDSSGRLLVGTSSARSNFYNSATTPDYQFETANAPRFSIVSSNSDGDFGAQFILAHQKSGAVGGNTILASGNYAGLISFQGSDGTDFVETARIESIVDGTPGANDMPGRLVFSTTADGASSVTERMRINNGGNVRMFAGAGQGGLALALTDNSASGQDGITLAHSATGIAGSGTVSFKVIANGNVTNTNNSYGAISDAKLKENIVDANSQWNDLKALQVRNYNFKEGQTHTQIGLVAQEAELVSPGLVNESPDRDNEGNDLGTVTKSVNYSVLYMKAVKALQEAMERIEILEARLTAAGIE